MRKNSFVFLVQWLFISFILFSGCVEKYQPGEPGSQILDQLSQTSGCVDCHLDENLLLQVATPLPPDTGGSSGEG